MLSSKNVPERNRCMVTEQIYQKPAILNVSDHAIDKITTILGHCLP